MLSQDIGFLNLVISKVTTDGLPLRSRAKSTGAPAQVLMIEIKS